MFFRLSKYTTKPWTLPIPKPFKVPNDWRQYEAGMIGINAVNKFSTVTLCSRAPRISFTNVTASVTTWFFRARHTNSDRIMFHSHEIPALERIFIASIRNFHASKWAFHWWRLTFVRDAKTCQKLPATSNVFIFAAWKWANDRKCFWFTSSPVFHTNNWRTLQRNQFSIASKIRHIQLL